MVGKVRRAPQRPTGGGTTSTGGTNGVSGLVLLMVQKSLRLGFVEILSGFLQGFFVFAPSKRWLFWDVEKPSTVWNR